MTKIVECVPNYSISSDIEGLNEILRPFRENDNVSLVNVEPDTSYNRTVVTLIGEPEALKKAMVESCKAAVRIIDMNHHHGEHKRMGAIDVIPFIPIQNMTIEETIALSEACAKEIYEASEKAKDVVRQISSLSRKNVETVYKNISIKKFMTRAERMMESVCTPLIHMESEFRVDDEMILGNATQLNQVLLNVCVNAVHAIGKNQGNIKISCHSEEKEKMAQGVIEKLSDVWKKYIHIQVKDNGCGMDKETLRQIFDPFFTTKKGGEGTGLGLALAEQIITSHKGYIYAESKKGEGSTFHIYLPVLDTEHMPQIVQNIPRKDYRIVVADDNAKVLQLLKKNFEKIGIQIQTCMKREELQKCLEQQQADVLVVDETMEDCSGVDFCMSLAGRYPDMLKLIIIDGVNREMAEARQKGIIDGYVEKPVSDTAILEAIRNRANQPV